MGPTAPRRDHFAVLRFVERFASMLTEAGMPRMPARVFVGLLASDSGRLTAAELADMLKVSPAAISGAVQYLAQARLISRGREIGSRRDHYSVHEDLWYESTLRRNEMLPRWQAGLREGVAALGPDTPAGQRVTETLEFFDFIQHEMPAMLERWHERRKELRASMATGARQRAN